MSWGLPLFPERGQEAGGKRSCKKGGVTRHQVDEWREMAQLFTPPRAFPAPHTMEQSP